MKIGLKLLPEEYSYLSKFKKGEVDFVEIWAVEGKKYDGFLKKKDVDFLVHCEDFKFDVNFGNPFNNVKNKQSLKYAFEVADKLKARYVVLHPGLQFNNKCTPDNFPVALKGFDKKRILIENQPPLKNKTYPHYCRNYDEIRQFLKNVNVGLCVDTCHAAASAHFYQKDPYEFIKELIEMGAKHFQVSNLMAGSWIDQHMHLFDGYLDFEKIRPMIPENATVSLETPMDLEKNKKEIAFLRGNA